MKIAQLLILILAFLVISPAKADLLIEPVVGVNLLPKLDLDGDEADGGTGLGYGGRLGYQTVGFQFGLDYLQSSIDIDDSDFKKNLDTTEWGVFAGFEFPVLLRVYAAYLFSVEGEAKTAGGDADFEDGTGVKLGVGFTILPFLDINVDYRRGTFDKTKIGGISSGETDFSAYMLSVSLPFTI